jgi:hypothetical protein
MQPLNRNKLRGIIFVNGKYKEIMDGAMLTKLKAVTIQASTWSELGRDRKPFH